MLLESRYIFIFLSCLLSLQCSVRDVGFREAIISFEKQGRALSGCQGEIFFVAPQILEKIQQNSVGARISFGNRSCSVIGERQTLVSIELSKFNAGYIWVKKVEIWSSKVFFNNKKKGFKKLSGFTNKALIKYIESQAQRIEEKVRGLRINRNLVTVEYFQFCKGESLDNCSGESSGIKDESPQKPLCENETPQEGVLRTITCEKQTLSACKKGAKDSFFVVPERIQPIREEQITLLGGYGNYSCYPVKTPLFLRSAGHRLGYSERIFVEKIELWNTKDLEFKMDRNFLNRVGYSSKEAFLGDLDLQARNLEEKFGFSINRNQITLQTFKYMLSGHQVTPEFTTKKGSRLSSCDEKEPVSDRIVVTEEKIKDLLLGRIFVHIAGGKKNCHRVGETVQIFKEGGKKALAKALVIKLSINSVENLDFNIILAAGFTRRPEVEALAEEGALNMIFIDVIKGKSKKVKEVQP